MSGLQPLGDYHKLVLQAWCLGNLQRLLISTSLSLSQVLGAGISSPPFTPLDPCLHLPMVSQATAPVEIGEAVLPRQQCHPHV